MTCSPFVGVISVYAREGALDPPAAVVKERPLDRTFARTSAQSVSHLTLGPADSLMPSALAITRVIDPHEMAARARSGPALVAGAPVGLRIGPAPPPCWRFMPARREPNMPSSPHNQLAPVPECDAWHCKCDRSSRGRCLDPAMPCAGYDRPTRCDRSPARPPGSTAARPSAQGKHHTTAARRQTPSPHTTPTQPTMSFALPLLPKGHSAPKFEPLSGTGLPLLRSASEKVELSSPPCPTYLQPPRPALRSSRSARPSRTMPVAC